MAFPSHVNNAITDSITQVNTLTIGDAPSMATGSLFVATSQALSNVAHNAANQQQQSYVTSLSSTNQSLQTLYSLEIGSTGVATAGVFRRGLV